MLKTLVLIILFFLAGMIGTCSIIGLFTHLALKMWSSSIYPPEAINAFWKSIGISIVVLIVTSALMEKENGK